MNPLASARATPPAAPEHPMQRHANMWKAIQSMPPDSLAANAALIDHVLPLQGALAGNPKVTAKDVIKAWTGLVADGKVDASQAVATISEMPADPEKLKPWLRQRYENTLSLAVHVKAALLRQAQQATQQPAQPVQPMAQPAQPGAPA